MWRRYPRPPIHGDEAPKPGVTIDCMPRSAAPIPGHLGDTFSFRAAIAAGASVRRLRNRDLIVPFRGVRMFAPRAADDVQDDDNPVASEAAEQRQDILRRARAYATIAPAHAFFCGPTAAVIWDLPLPIRVLRGDATGSERGAGRRGARDLDVAVFAPRRASRASGVHGRKIHPDLTSVRDRDGLRVASPASVWAQLAPLLSVDELIEVGDAIVREPRIRGMERASVGSGLATLEQLATAVSAGRRTGATKLREALPLVRIGSSSPAETRFRLALIRSGLPEPQLDLDVFTIDGRPIGFTELAYVEHRILVEYEGDHHRTSREQWQRDIEKHAACVAAGWTVVRITSLDTRRGSMAGVHRVRDALRRAGWRD
jgi:hypothetical protein